MAVEVEVVLGVTQIEHVIDYADIEKPKGVKDVNYIIYVPSPDACRAHYKERELPPIEIFIKEVSGSLGNESIDLTIKTFSPSDYPVRKNGSEPTDTFINYGFNTLPLAPNNGYISLRTMKSSLVNAWYADSILITNPK